MTVAVDAALVLVAVVGVCAWAVMRSRRRLDAFSRARRAEAEDATAWRDR